MIPGIPYLPTPGPGIARTIPHIAPQLLKLAAHMVLEATRNSAGKIKVQKVIYSENLRIREAVEREGANAVIVSTEPEEIGNEPPPRWGALGDIEFDLLMAPSGFSGDEGVVYAQHAVIGGKPHVQFTGKKLRKITLSLAWHQMAMEDIENSFEALRAAMNEQKVMKLVIGQEKTGSYYAGDFVIEDMPYNVTKYNPDGSILGLELTVNLLEWNTGKPLEPGQHDPPKAVRKPNLASAQKTGVQTGTQITLSEITKTRREP